MPPRLWEHMTVNEIRDALATTQTVLIPVGCTEQHGYHLPTRADCYAAEVICNGASDQTGALVVPTLAYTYSGGELPGTINISPAVVTLLIQEILRDLTRQGWQNLVIVLGHGGSENDLAVAEGADMFLRTHPDRAAVNVAIYRFWQVSPIAMRGWETRDFHAGYLETAILLAAAPDQVRPEIALDPPEHVAMMRDDPDNYQVRVRNVDDPAVIPHIHQNPETQVGVIGDPTGATAEVGNQFFAESIAGLADLIRKLEGKGCPPPSA